MPQPRDSAARSPIEARLALPMPAAAELQEHLLIAGRDLERLQALLAHASEELLAGFQGAREALLAPGGDARAALERLGDAVTALQFQDLASQLIAHTGQRLRHCADRLGRDAFLDDDAAVVADAPPRPNPVTQSEMDTGSIELF